MNQQFDDQFKKIKSLKWLPWIGDKFLDLNSDNRIMVIGESHYFRPEEIDKEKHEKEDFTRTVVAEMALKKNYYKTKFFQNTLRGILGKKGPEFIDFWNQVAFMNLVQKPIQKDTAPTQQDFLIGWEACFEVIRVIKPAICLFIGVEASNFFPKAAKQNNHFKSDGMEKKSKVVQTYPRVVNLLTNNQEKVSKLVFIRHSSQYFSWSKWHHQFLKHEIPGPIQFLKRQLTVMSIDEKKQFLLDDLEKVAWNAAFQRASQYKSGMKEDEKLIFKEQLMGFIKSELIPNYNPKVSEKQHLNNIKCLQEEATKLGNDLLTSGGLKWDVAQKLLNLLLKHYWCLGLIEEPPHCPVDKKLSEQTGMENKVHRSDFISEETYKAVIDAIRKKIEGTDKSIAQWELEIFNEL